MKKNHETMGCMFCDMLGLILKRRWDMDIYMSMTTEEGRHGKYIEVTLPATWEEKAVANLRIPTDDKLDG